MSPYAASKWRNEEQLSEARAFGLEAISLRFFNVYGPTQQVEDMPQSFQPSFNRSRQVRLQWCMAMVVKLGISSTYSMSSAPLRRLSRSIGYA